MTFLQPDPCQIAYRPHHKNPPATKCDIAYDVKRVAATVYTR